MLSATMVLDFIDFCRGVNDPVVELECLLPIDGSYNLLKKKMNEIQRRSNVRNNLFI